MLAEPNPPISGVAHGQPPGQQPKAIAAPFGIYTAMSPAR